MEKKKPSMVAIGGTRHGECDDTIAALEQELEKWNIVKAGAERGGLPGTLDQMFKDRDRLEQENARLQAELHEKQSELDEVGRVRHADCWRKEDEAQMENARLKTNCMKLQRAIMRMAEAALPPEQRAADTAAVGGPVSDYSFTYDEQVARDSVIGRLVELERENARLLQEIGEWELTNDTALKAHLKLKEDNARLQAELHDARINLVSSEQDKTRLQAAEFYASLPRSVSCFPEVEKLKSDIEIATQIRRQDNITLYDLRAEVEKLKEWIGQLPCLHRPFGAFRECGLVLCEVCGLKEHLGLPLYGAEEEQP